MAGILAAGPNHDRLRRDGCLGDPPQSTTWLIRRSPSTLLKLLGVAVLVLANAFFVAAEFALVSVRRTRISELLEQGNATARWVAHAISEPGKAYSGHPIGDHVSQPGSGVDW